LNGEIYRKKYLFDPFNRLDREHGASEGTGIGLRIAQKLAELIGGRIDLKSPDGDGCEFWADIPTAINK
jgi:signal transduction histidine kinase